MYKDHQLNQNNLHQFSQLALFLASEKNNLTLNFKDERLPIGYYNSHLKFFAHAAHLAQQYYNFHQPTSSFILAQLTTCCTPRGRRSSGRRYNSGTSGRVHVRNSDLGATASDNQGAACITLLRPDQQLVKLLTRALPLDHPCVSGQKEH